MNRLTTPDVPVLVPRDQLDDLIGALDLDKDAQDVLLALAESTQLLSAVGGTRKAIERALAVVGRASRAERIVIMRASGTTAGTTYAWWSAEPMTIPPVSAVDFRDPIVGALVARLNEGEAVHIDVGKLPARLARALRERGTETMLVVAINANATGQPWGYVVLSATTTRQFSASERAIIQLVAANIGAAIAHDQLADARLKNQHTLLEARRSQSLSLLSAGIAHDFNSLLAVITSTLSLAKLGDDSELDRGIEAASQARDLIERLTGLSENRVTQDREPRRLRPTIERTVDILSRQVSDGIVVTLSGPREISHAIDPIHLQQIVLNLVLNASEAIGDGDGHIDVQVELSDDRVLLHVLDDGPGIAIEPASDVFHRWVSSKGKHRGLGLAAVQQLVTLYGGEISVESRPGATRFVVALPTTIPA